MPNLSRRNFVFLAAAATLASRSVFAADKGSDILSHPYSEVETFDRHRVLTAAERYLRQQPRTITSVPALRSAGGLHDYFSEGDYWWPNPKDPKGPYIRRDGESNPANFTAHRDLLIRLSI